MGIFGDDIKRPNERWDEASPSTLSSYLQSPAMTLSYRAALSYTILFTCLLAGMSTAKYFSLHTAQADLGFMMNNLNRIALGEFWRLFWGHAQPLLLPYSWVYGHVPGNWAPVILLSLQAFAIGGVLFGILRLWGWLPGLAYVLYFPVWYNALFDFHLDHLSIPILFGFFVFAQKGRFWPAGFLAIILALVKEPFALQAIGCGLYLILAYHKRAIGVLVIIAAAAYFKFSVDFLIPYVTPGNLSTLASSAYVRLGGTISEMIFNILADPIGIVGMITEPGKLFYVFGMLAGLSFLSILSPGPLLVALPILAISLLSDNPGYYGLKHHYTAGLILPLVLAFYQGARKIDYRWPNRSVKLIGLSIAVILLGHMAYAPSPLTRLFWSEKLWSYGYSAYHLSERGRQISAALAKYIPEDPSVTVSAQNTVNNAILAHRKYYYIYPLGVSSPADVPDGEAYSLNGFMKFVLDDEKPPSIEVGREADYVVLDRKKPWFLEDQGCEWLYGECRDLDAAARYERSVSDTLSNYKTLYSHDGFMILAR